MDQRVSGLYKETFSTPAERRAKETEIELRVDVDGERPMKAISGDIYSNSRRIHEYLYSFRFEEVKKTKTAANEIMVTGEEGKFDPALCRFEDIEVTIHLDSRPLEATVKLTNTPASVSRCRCKFVSKYFRSVELEHDYEEGVAPIEPYETSELCSPATSRSHPLTISDAFSEAGIELLVVKEKKDSVSHPKSTRGDSVWADIELREAMAKHFTMLKEEPQWKVWLLSANEHVMSNTYGVAIDREGRKRRGCAVFQDATGCSSAEEKRLRLFICVHELGHCFNLHHPWDKPQSDSLEETEGRATLSWMNLPWLYYLSEESRGEEAFWKAFNFQFSDAELMHLRHGFRNDVIFGGNTFGGEMDSIPTGKEADKERQESS